MIVIFFVYYVALSTHKTAYLSTINTDTSFRMGCFYWFSLYYTAQIFTIIKKDNNMPNVDNLSFEKFDYAKKLHKSGIGQTYEKRKILSSLNT